MYKKQTNDKSYHFWDFINVNNLPYCDSGRKKYFLVILLWQFDCNIIWKQRIAWKVLNISNIDIISSWKVKYLSYCVCFSSRYDNSSMKTRWQYCSLLVLSCNKYLLDFKELIIFIFEKFSSFSLMIDLKMRLQWS